MHKSPVYMAKIPFFRSFKVSMFQCQSYKGWCLFSFCDTNFQRMFPIRFWTQSQEPDGRLEGQGRYCGGGWGHPLPIPDVRVVSFKLFRCKLNMFLSHWTWWTPSFQYLSSRGRDPPFKIFECVHCTALSGKLLHSQKLVEEMIERYKTVHNAKFAPTTRFKPMITIQEDKFLIYTKPSVTTYKLYEVFPNSLIFIYLAWSMIPGKF